MSKMINKITRESLNGLNPSFPLTVTYPTRDHLKNDIAETIRRAAREIDIRGLIDEVCGAWNVRTPIGFATDLKNKIVDHMIEKADGK